MSRTKQIIALVVSLGIAFSVAWMGSFFTDLSIGTWYPTLIKPAWTPSARHHRVNMDNSLRIDGNSRLGCLARLWR